MNKKYVIQWKSKINGRAGRGTKHFEQGEALRLADELNQEYPDIEHQIAELPSDSSEGGNQPPELEYDQQAQTSASSSSADPNPVLSLKE